MKYAQLVMGPAGSGKVLCFAFLFNRDFSLRIALLCIIIVQQLVVQWKW